MLTAECWIFAVMARSKLVTHDFAYITVHAWTFHAKLSSQSFSFSFGAIHPSASPPTHRCWSERRCKHPLGSERYVFDATVIASATASATKEETEGEQGITYHSCWSQLNILHSEGLLSVCFLYANNFTSNGDLIKSLCGVVKGNTISHVQGSIFSLHDKIPGTSGYG
jgi:hypothetical protein